MCTAEPCFAVHVLLLATNVGNLICPYKKFIMIHDLPALDTPWKVRLASIIPSSKIVRRA